MLEFIQLLKQRYHLILTQIHHEPLRNLYAQRIEELLLTEAFLRKGSLLGKKNNHPRLPLNIAVIGPTQSGKSSLVNVLCAADVAGVSPLAGYTVHPQGFCHQVPIDHCVAIQQYFSSYHYLNHAEHLLSHVDSYTLTAINTRSVFLPPCVIWDTPDFDSIDSTCYRASVLQTIALADIIILVISKEKYADQAVWEIMAMLEDLQQPTLICLNKLSEGNAHIIINSLHEKWQQARSDAFPEVIELYYQKPIALPNWPAQHHATLQQLAKKRTTAKQDSVALTLIQKHWHTWLEPVYQEHQAINDWQNWVNESIDAALASYQHEYLDQPQLYETFQRTLAELLLLLEIPGLAGVLTHVRKVLTWPVKQIMKLSYEELPASSTSHELTLLHQLAEHVLIQALDKSLDNAEQRKQNTWWKELSLELRAKRGDILHDFSSAATDYHHAFQAHIEQSAHSLYDKLQEQPFILNSLRATRVTADAAAIAISLNTGGVGLHDLLIAPAMVSVTSLLTESALGNYLQHTEEKLKKRQYHEVKHRVFLRSLKYQLMQLPTLISAKAQFNIPPEQVQMFEQQLSRQRHGLRLL